MRLAVLADDLTGAADTGVQFARFGLPARVWLADGPVEDGATVFDTDSRSLAPADAAARVGRLAERLRGADHVYKKIDSTLRGNVGAEIEACLRGLGRSLAVLAPAFPANRRTTLRGVQLVDGVPVHETALARDPAHPMRHPTIAAALRAQSELDVVDVPLRHVHAGGLHLADLFVELTADRAPRAAVVDAETDADLNTIAQAIAQLGPTCLPVGSAGLAAAWGLVVGEREGLALSPLHLDFPPGARGQSPLSNTDPPRRRILFVCGSLNPTSRAQVAALPDHAELICSDDTAGDPTAVARQLAETTQRAVERRRPDALVLTGGDTARAVLTALNARGIALDAELLPGIPRGTVIGGLLDGTTVVTKAGGFGPPDTLVRVQRHLQELDR